MPQGDYKRTYPVTSTGMIFSMVYRLKPDSPVSIGGELGVLQVSASKKHYGDYLVSSNNHIISLSPVVRVDLLEEDKKSNLFVDVKFGCNLFLTAATISSDYEDPLTNTTVVTYYYSEFKTSYAFRAGTGVGFERMIGKKGRVWWLVKGSYLYGSHARYYAKPKIDGMNITLFPRQSKTSMILGEAGIRFSIGKKSRNR